jgi:DNA-binding response OmpR family regulator
MDGKPVSVLLIEDNPGDARLIGEILASESSSAFTLDHVNRLDRALARLDQGGVDVALVDLSLPDSHGIETFQRIRAHAPEVPIVILTGLRDQSVEENTLLAGGQEYLHKGALDLCVLHKSILHAIERNRGGPDAARVAQAIEVVKHENEARLAALGDELRACLSPAQAALNSLMDQATTAHRLLPALVEIHRQVELATRLIDQTLSRTRSGPPDGAIGATDGKLLVDPTPHDEE